MAEELDTERVRAIMTRFFAEMQAMLERHGGTVEKYIGDAVMAVFGIPTLHEDDALRAVRAAAELCAAEGVRGAPRIAVCGLNPHAGEGGLLGTEERDHIDPLLDRLRAAHPGLSRALPGDTVFVRQLRGEFDAVVALYHDQGLAPLKTLEFDHAVNITLGLPHVRTSPDHGTGFDLAGRGLASATSFAHAVRVARALVARRRLRGAA